MHVYSTDMKTQEQKRNSFSSQCRLNNPSHFSYLNVSNVFISVYDLVLYFIDPLLHRFWY